MNGVADFYQPFVFWNMLIGLIIALVVGAGAIWLAKQVGLLDVPGSLPHKKHKVPVPLAGGIALAASLAMGALFNPGLYREMWPIFVPALIVLGFGLWDDFKRLPAWIKFIGQLLAGILLIFLGTYAQVIQPGFLGLRNPLVTWLNWFITIFWIVGITNAFNLIDSMDGLVIGTSGIGLAFLILMTLGSTQILLLRLLTLLLGICFGLYFYNHTPARLFLGDSGAQTFGFILAAVGIQFTPGTHPLGSSWFIPILIMGVPIFDTTLVTISRLRRRTPIYSAGLNHTYHRLVAMGLDSGRAVLIMHFATVVLGCIAFIALQLPPGTATLIFGFVCLAGFILILWLDRKK